MSHRVPGHHRDDAVPARIAHLMQRHRAGNEPVFAGRGVTTGHELRKHIARALRLSIGNDGDVQVEVVADRFHNAGAAQKVGLGPNLAARSQPLEDIQCRRFCVAELLLDQKRHRRLVGLRP